MPTGGLVLRKVTTTPTDTLVYPDDFTYLGSYAIPSLGDMSYGNGFALRRESSDLVNPIHLITAAFSPSVLWTGTQRVKLSMRGSIISVYINTGSGYPSTPNISVVDTSISSAGRAGIFTNITAGYSLDNLVATNDGGSVFVSDTFTGTNGTTLASHIGAVGATWTVHPTLADGTLQIQSNATILATGSAPYYFSSGIPSNADYDVEADINYLSGNASMGVLGRCNTTTGNTYLASYSNVWGSKLWALGKWVAGVYTTIALVPSGGTGIAAYTFEWRDITPQNPVNPTVPSSYTAAPVMKEWGNIYGSGPSKRIILLGGNPYDFSDGQAGTQRWAGFGWDPVDELLYYTFGETYTTESGWYLSYSALNYSTGASTPHGSWETDATQFKGGLSGVLTIPSSFVTAAGLGTKRLAVIGTPPASVQASGDVSPGPQVVAFVPPTSSTELTSLASTKLIGYSPFTNDPAPGQGRALRPASIQWYQGPGSAAVIPFSNWPEIYWNGYDDSIGGVWIHGANKSGLIIVGQLFKGQVTYLNATIIPQMIANAISIVSEEDLLSVALGDAQPYEIQPTTVELTAGVFDPADYTSVQVGNVATVTVVAGTKRSVGAILTTTAPHGFSSGGYIGVIGTSNIEYNDNWAFTVINATQIQIYNLSLDSYTFSGVPATGGTLWYVGYGAYPGTGIRILGLAYDEPTKQMYLGFVSKAGIPLVSVWSVNC